MVVRDLVEIETATFWKDGPEIDTGELTTADIGTEVFFLPAAAHTEKDGTFTQTQRMLQWHHKAVEPQGDCRSELWFYFHLGRIIREKLAGSTEARDRPVLDLTWDYPLHGDAQEPDAEAVLREINGVGPDGLLPGFTALKADGSTACGCWIYSGCFAGGVNQTARRRPGAEQSWVAPEWGWAWPANRRILYNRASADPTGSRGRSARRYVWWDAGGRPVDGPRRPRLRGRHARPTTCRPRDATAEWALRGDRSVHHAERRPRAGCSCPTACSTARCRPTTSPTSRPSPTRCTASRPTRPARRSHRKGNRYNDDDGADYPFVMTTYRLTEHHTAGGMSRFLARLSELQPEMFCEVSPALAAERGLVNGGWATITSARTAIEARVLVTDRVKPLEVQGRELHQVGLPYHWGWKGRSTGDAANDLFPLALDPNVHIQEVKAATCDIRWAAGTRVLGPRPPLPAGPQPRRHAAGVAEPVTSQAHGVLHRHLHLHRVQGVRGGVQGVERRPRRRPRLPGHVLRQHRRASAPTPGATWPSSSSPVDGRPAIGHGRASVG